MTGRLCFEHTCSSNLCRKHRPSFGEQARCKHEPKFAEPIHDSCFLSFAHGRVDDTPILAVRERPLRTEPIFRFIHAFGLTTSNVGSINRGLKNKSVANMNQCLMNKDAANKVTWGGMFPKLWLFIKLWFMFAMRLWGIPMPCIVSVLQLSRPIVGKRL